MSSSGVVVTTEKRSSTSETAARETISSDLLELLRKGFRTVPRGIDPNEIRDYLETMAGSGRVALGRLQRFLASREAAKIVEVPGAQGGRLTEAAKITSQEAAQAEAIETAACFAGEIPTGQSADAVEKTALSDDSICEAVDVRPRADEQGLSPFQTPGPSDAASTVSPLTPRETEILRHVAEGRSNRQVAVGLGIAEQTVKHHVSSLLRKLNASRRTEAVALAIRQGLVSIT
jgi:DNA-binding CsgD family transcriptional regulator